MSDTDQPESPVENEKSFINGDRPYTPNFERPGCISAYLILGIIGNCICGLFYMFLISSPIKAIKILQDVLMLFVILIALNIYFCVKLFLYKKSGFYGLTIGTLAGCLINLYNGLSPVICILGLGGIPLLYAVLQARSNGIPFWKRLK